MLTLSRFLFAILAIFVWLVVLGPRSREEAWRYYDTMVNA